MLKLSLTHLLTAGTLIAATCTSSTGAQDLRPLADLQSTARLLMVFAPDTNTPSYKRQFNLIEHHSYQLTEHNTVVVSLARPNDASDAAFPGENLFLSDADQDGARRFFHVQPSQFLVLLLGQDGTEAIRSTSPVDMQEIVARLAALDRVQDEIARSRKAEMARR